MKPLRLSLSMCTLFVLAASTAWAASLTHGPIVGVVTSTTAVVFLRTDVPATGRVRIICCSVPFGAPFDTGTQEGDTCVETTKDCTALVPVGNLPADASLTVQVYLDPGDVLQDQTSTFKTFPPANLPATFLFAHITDFAGPTESPSPGDVFDRVADENPGFVLIGGDFDHRNPGQGLDPSQTTQALTNYREMFKSLYDPESPGMLKLVTRILRAFPIAHVVAAHAVLQ
jgi:hypothetical protein